MKLKLWLKFGVLTILLTVGFACGAFVNDLKNQNAPGKEQVYNSAGHVGTSAHDLLSNETFRDLTIEIQYTGEFAPTQEALNKIQDFLSAHLNKNIALELPVQIESPHKTAYSVADIMALENQNRKLFSTKDRLTAYYLFVDAPSRDDHGNEKLLGQAYRNTSMVIYEKTIQDLATVNLPLMEGTVMAHEFGHIMGLVNIGTSAQNLIHVDSTHHCANPFCLMNRNAETSRILQQQLVERIPDFDEDCLADLRRNGGK